MHEWFRAYYNVLVVLFAVGGAIPLARQARAIWIKKSGESVSIVWFSYTFFLAMCSCLYGTKLEDLLIQVNGMVRIFGHIPILLGLLVNKGFTKSEKLIFVLLFLYILVMLQFPLQAWQFYFAMSLCLTVATLRQRREIVKGKSAGVVKCEILVFRILGNVVWITYALIAARWLVAIVVAINFFALMFTLLEWIKYRK